MAVTTTTLEQTIPGAATQRSVRLLLDNAYPAGGYVLDMTKFGLGLTRRVIDYRPYNFASSGYVYSLDIAYGGYGAIGGMTLRMRVLGTGAEVATGADVSAASVHVIFEGS